MKFSEIIDGLKEGHIYQRNAWDGNKAIMMQIPAVIPADVVPKMTSVQPALKQYLSTVGSGAISYHDQVLIVNMVDDMIDTADVVEKILCQARERKEIFTKLFS